MSNTQQPEPLRKARAASSETKISALMSKISTLVDKRLSCEPCAEAEEDLLQFLRTRYAAPAHPAEGVPDERAAFEKWLGIKLCGAAHDLAWSSWKARAALAATQARNKKGIEQ